MTNDEISRLKLDVALARALLDEVERAPDGADPRVMSQLVEELSRIAGKLAEHTNPASGAKLIDRPASRSLRDVA